MDNQKLIDALGALQFRAAQAHVLAMALAHTLDGVMVDALGDESDAGDGVRGIAGMLDRIREDLVNLTNEENGLSGD
jgi:hypothetical protein